MKLASTRRCLVWAAVLLGLAASTASAKPKIAILGIEAVGAVDPSLTDLAKDLTTALRGRAGSGKFSLLASKRELVDEKLMSNCQSMALSCMGAIANNLGADYMLYGSIEKVPRKGVDGYHIMLYLLVVTKSPNVGGDLAKASGQNPVDDWRSAKEMNPAPLEKWVDSVYARLSGEEVEKAPAKLTVHATNTRTGTVFINGADKGQLDDGRLTLTLVPDQSYQLAIEADGFRRYEQKVKVTSGQTETAEFELIKLDAPPPPPPGGRSSRAKFIWIGAGSLVGSGVMWAVFLRELLGPIKKYKDLINDGNPANNPYFTTDDMMRPLESGNCDVNLSSADVNASMGVAQFNAACDAKKRQVWEGIAGGALGVLGAGLVLYGVLTSGDAESRRPTALRLTPMVTPQVAGAVLDVRW